MLRVSEYQTIHTVLLKHTSESRAKKLAEELLEALYPIEWEEEEKLEGCHQCGGKGQITIVISHPGNSRTHWQALCGPCKGTGKLARIEQEYR